MIKVSVVIPIYNAQRHIEQCLNSILKQTLKETEIICVDDGSTDNSVEIIKKYSKEDSRVKLITQQNAYAGVARNNGMKSAQGEYIIFLDADDFFEPDMLKEMYEKSVADNADVCLCSARKYNEKTGEFIYSTNYLETKYFPENCPFSADDASLKLFNLVTPAPWTKMFKKSFVDKTGIKFQASKKANDLFFVYSNLALAERITYVSKIFVNYRIENEGSLQGEKKFSFDFYNALLALKKELAQRGIYGKFEQTLANRALGTFFYELDRISDKETFIKVLDEYKKRGFYKMGILGHSRGYVYNKPYYDRIMAIYETPAEEYWQLMQEKPQPVERVNLKEWTSPIKLDENGKAKVSVIIPVYNTEEYLKDCIESVINQTLKNIEIICVDDGSTDGSAEILKAYAQKDERIKIITKQNGGLSSSRNVGIAAASGEYILLLDSDDFIELKALEYLYCEAKAADLDQLFFTARSFYHEDFSDADYSYDRKNNYNTVVTGKEMFIAMANNAEFKPSACLQIIKREFIEKEQIKFIEGIYYEDNPFTIECLFKSQRVRYDNAVLYQRRIRKGSIMSNTDGLDSSYRYFLTIQKVRDVAVRCNFAAEREFYAAFLMQLTRMCFVSTDMMKMLDADEIMDFVVNLDEKSGIDYYFYIKIAAQHRRAITDLSKAVHNDEEKLIMDKYKAQCRELEQAGSSKIKKLLRAVKRRIKKILK